MRLREESGGVGRDRHRIQVVGAAGMGQERRDRRSNEQRIADCGVKQWPLTAEVPGAERQALLPVPQHEREVAFEPLGAMLAPGTVGGEDVLAWV